MMYVQQVFQFISGMMYLHHYSGIILVRLLMVQYIFVQIVYNILLFIYIQLLFHLMDLINIIGTLVLVYMDLLLLDIVF